MTDPLTIADNTIQTDLAAPSRRTSLFKRWYRKWNGSFRVRLLVLGMLPLLVAFPFILGILALMGSEFTNSLLTFNLRKDLSTSQNYIDQLKLGAGSRVSQLARSDKLIELAKGGNRSGELTALLRTAAQGSGFDFLLVASADGHVMGASNGTVENRRLPDSYVIRQATIGVANAAYERFDAEQLAVFSPDLVSMAGLRPATADAGVPTQAAHGLLIHAGAHLPLSVDTPDAILLGGILLNKNFALVEHMREIVYPVDSQPDNAEGMTAIYMDDVDIAVSRQRNTGISGVGSAAPPGVTDHVIGRGQSWLGQVMFGEQSYIAGFEPLINGQNERIGMIGVAFPDQPYKRKMWLVLGMVAGLLALTMLTLSGVIVRVGRAHAQRLGRLAETMRAYGKGRRDARVAESATPDELDRLGRHFNRLLDTIAEQDARQQAAQKTLADEASRRRALFENERDGVVILNPDGSVFEANPKSAAMLGYTMTELQDLHVQDWDVQFKSQDIAPLLQSLDKDGLFLETVQQRKDGSTYPAEVSLSRAAWGDRTFVLVLQRDISQRKSTERELDEYRQTLEDKVTQRTRELNERSEQLATIFTLSPDGFVSFDTSLRVSFANQSFLRMTGMDADTLIGMHEDRFTTELISRCLQPNLAPGTSLLRDMRQEIMMTGTDAERGPRRRVELALPGSRVLELGLQLSESDSVSQILYVRDITVETEVDRMKSEFLSTAAHELRTPMTSIYGYTELLLTQEFDAETRSQFLSTIYHQSELMTAIINELLDLARIEARRGKDFRTERLPLQELVRAALSGYQSPKGRGTPRIAGTDEHLLVDVDPQKIRQVILNIVSNAYKYSPQGGEVLVRFETRRDHDRIRHGFSVQDQGIGMNADQLQRVCERFYRADTSGKIPGTGLGMSIVKEIVDLLGGDIELHSQPGVGTTVCVWLPGV